MYFRPVAGEHCDTIAADVPWLSESTTSATVQPGTTVTVALTADARTLAPGTYQATVLIRTTDPGARVPITLTVRP